MSGMSGSRQMLRSDSPQAIRMQMLSANAAE